MAPEPNFNNEVKRLYHMLVLGCLLMVIGVATFLYLAANPSLLRSTPDEEIMVLEEDGAEDQIIEGIHVATGFVEGEGLNTVIQNCTNCHSAKLVTQNRMSKEGWIATIRWMQETQNLWDLGQNEAIIVDYLATYYAPDEKGRRDPLVDIEWYELQP